MPFIFKTVQQILGNQLAITKSQISGVDILKGSVIYTLLQASALEDAQQYVAMSEILDTFNLENVSGEELEKRAIQFGLVVPRIPKSASTGSVKVFDSSFAKVSTKIFSGLPGPISGSLTINIESSTGFPSSGSVIIGRGKNSVEVVPYTSISDNTTYQTLNLSSSTLFDHGTDESVILSQGGDRYVNIGDVVSVPDTDTSPSIKYVVISKRVLLDGESEITGIPVVAEERGALSRIPPNAIREFTSAPFANASVVNETSITNGSDTETDSELRDRIKNHIQSLSKGTIRSVTTGILGLTNTEQNKRIVSASFVEPISTTDISKLYIDDGSGFEPIYEGYAIDSILSSATGNRKLLQLTRFPVVKAQAESSSLEPYNISSGDTLTVFVGGVSETITFGPTDFKTNGSARAQEVVEAINNLSSLLEARTALDKTIVTIQSIGNNNESIIVSGGTANSSLNFPQGEIIDTIRLYKNDKLLSKDGSSAFVESGNTSPFPLTNGQTLDVVVDGKISNSQTITFNAGDFVLIGNATSQEVVDAINKELAGAVAIPTDGNSRIRITSNTVNSSNSKINITGGTANIILGFDTAEVIGTDFDYKLNRLNGKIELNNPLAVGDAITVGSSNTRGFIDSTSPEPYVVSSGEVIEVDIDGGLIQSYTFTSNGSFTAEQISNMVSPSLIGAKIFPIQKQTKTYLRIRTNTWDKNLGSIKVTTNTTADLLSFPENILSTNDESNVSYSETQSLENFDIGRDQNLILGIDDEVENKFNIVIQVNGAITTGNNATTFIDSSLTTNFTTDNFFTGFDCQFANDTSTANIVDSKRTVTAYNSTTGEITVGVAYPDIPVIGDTFVLIPKTAKNVVDLLNSKSITSLSTIADIQESDKARRVQISSKKDGSIGKVQVNGGTANGFSIPLSTNGTVTGTFSVGSIFGLSIGLDVKIEDDDTASTTGIITNITSSGPTQGASIFIIEIDNGITDLSLYTVGKNAKVRSVNGLNFASNAIKTGIDGYRYYTGLLGDAQLTIDGSDKDKEKYPGIKAAGIHIEVKPPVIKTASVIVDITTENNISLSTVINTSKSLVANYINSLKVGENIIIAKIVQQIMRITLVKNVKVEFPTDDVVIADNEIARISFSDIVIG